MRRASKIRKKEEEREREKKRVKETGKEGEIVDARIEGVT